MKIVLNAPVTIGEQAYAAGAEIDVDEETATALRSDGKAGLPFDPKSVQEGNYTSSTGRSAVSGESTTPPPVEPKKKT